MVPGAAGLDGISAACVQAATKPRSNSERLRTLIPCQLQGNYGMRTDISTPDNEA